MATQNMKTKVTVTTEDLVSIRRAAKELGVHFVTVYRWIYKGEVIPFRIGKQVFLTVEDVRRLKEQREQGENTN